MLWLYLPSTKNCKLWNFKSYSINSPPSYKLHTNTQSALKVPWVSSEQSEHFLWDLRPYTTETFFPRLHAAQMRRKPQSQSFSSSSPTDFTMGKSHLLLTSSHLFIQYFKVWSYLAPDYKLYSIPKFQCIDLIKTKQSLCALILYICLTEQQSK